MAVLDLGRHQQRNDGVVNGGTPFEILETDIVGRDFVDSLEVHGVGLDEVFGGLGPADVVVWRCPLEPSGKAK
jgi:hypothetical protein